MSRHLLPQRTLRQLVRELIRTARRGVEHLREHRLLFPFIIAGAIVTVLLVGATGSAFWWTSQPSFCGRCHVMDPFIEAWEESPHEEVNCESCHTQPGAFGFVGGKIASLQVTFDYVTGHYDDSSFNAAVSNAACLECHEDITERVIQGRSVRVSHEHIVGEGGKCINCHSTTAHGDAVPIGSRTQPAMDNCLQCHDGETAPLDCNICHTGEAQTGAGLGHDTKEDTP